MGNGKSVIFVSMWGEIPEHVCVSGEIRRINPSPPMWEAAIQVCFVKTLSRFS